MVRPWGCGARSRERYWFDIADDACSAGRTERRGAQRIAEDAEFLGGALSAAAAADSFQWTIPFTFRRLGDAAELWRMSCSAHRSQEEALGLAGAPFALYRTSPRCATTCTAGQCASRRKLRGDRIHTGDRCWARKSHLPQIGHGHSPQMAPGGRARGARRAGVCWRRRSGRSRIVGDAILQRAARSRW